MLWPAQQLIGEKGVLRGQSAIVQLPTGVGKTKSIELVIRSSFASGRATTAIIVAPLRALCNEIANDMISAFGDEVLVNQFSDVLEEDFSLELFLSFKSKILICTPEKLSYIIHHQADFLDEIGLYIFDEGHMFDDGSRGAIYELLISEIRSHISGKEQIILLSAVLSNAEQIQKWLLGEAGVLASDSKIKATPKTIGFASQTKDIHYYSDDADKQAVAADICKGTLAYFMANDNEKALLERIFDVITSKISELEQSQIKNYARTMVGIKLSLQIEKWIAENHLTQQNYTDEQLVKMLISFFQETHTLKKEIDCFADICQMWLEGCSFVEMHERTSLPIADLEDICSKFISYELSFFVGNVMDIIEINDEDLVNPLPNLLLLQRRLKYGVKTETAVSVCEKIFNDRFLANLLADEIGHDSIEANSIVGVIKSHKDDILDILSAYPTYFSERVQWICKD